MPLLTDELTSAYYNDVCYGLHVFERIERHMESVTFLLEQRNYQAATEELCVLENEVKQPDILRLLEECTMTATLTKRIESKRNELEASIFDSITSFLFMKRANSMVIDRCELIYNFVCSKLANEEDLSVFFQSDKAYLIQDKLTTIARQDYENVFSVRKLLNQIKQQDKKSTRDSSASLDYSDPVEDERLELI